MAESGTTGKHNKIDCIFHTGSLASLQLTTQLFHMSRRQEPKPLHAAQKNEKRKNITENGK